MKDRIKEIMESKHMNNKVFANFTGINEGTLSLLLRDKAQPTLKIYEAIHKHFPDISMEWLFDGVGPMYNAAAASKSSRSSSDGSESFSDASASPAGAGTSSPLLFAGDQRQSEEVASNGKSVEKTVVKYIDKPQRKITEIRVFFDDQTWESFVPKE